MLEAPPASATVCFSRASHKIVKAQAPLAELFGYAAQIRTLRVCLEVVLWKGKEYMLR